MAWGIGCGEGIPAIYASVPDAMCWIDWVMTCVKLATEDINNKVDEDPVSVREDEDGVLSANGLSVDECGQWRQANENKMKELYLEVFEFCDIIYHGDK